MRKAYAQILYVTLVWKHNFNRVEFEPGKRNIDCYVGFIQEMLNYMF